MANDKKNLDANASNINNKHSEYLRRHYVPCYEFILASREIKTLTARVVLCYLIRKDRHKSIRCTVSNEKISEDLNISVKTVERAVGMLEEIGLLEQKKRGDSTRRAYTSLNYAKIAYIK